ncbi:MAG TPA: ABC transporter permease [Acidimicrobiales bacterium]
MRSSLRASSGRFLPALVAFVLAGLIWQLIAFHTQSIIPPLGSIISALNANPHLLFEDGVDTLQESLVGLAAGFVVAFAAAVAMSEVRVLERALMPLAVVLNVTPLVAIAPGLGIAFGFGYAPKYILTGIIVFFPFLVNASIGLRSVEPEALNVLATLRASRPEILWRLRFPSSLPFLFAAARVCLPLSIVGAVVAEFTASGFSKGLGYLVLVSAQNTQLGLEFAAIFCLAAMGIIYTAAISLCEHRLLRWHVSARPARN